MELEKKEVAIKQQLPATTPEESKAKQLVFAAQRQFEASNTMEMNFIREAGFAIQILQGNSFLAGCDHVSIKNAIANVALTGLTLNPVLKQAYLVPRNGKCVLDPSYMGLIKVITDAGSAKNIDACVVYSNDKFEYERGTNPFIKHIPTLSNRGDLIGVYAIAYFRDGGFQFEVMGKEEVEKVRATSESYKKEATRKYSPWETWEDEMYKKTAVKRLYKLLPKTNFSESLIAALSIDSANELNDLPNTKKDKYSDVFEDVTEQ